MRHGAWLPAEKEGATKVNRRMPAGMLLCLGLFLVGNRPAAAQSPCRQASLTIYAGTAFFGGVPLGKSFTRTDFGGAPALEPFCFGTPTISGPDKDAFTISNNTCVGLLPTGQSCTFHVTFTPTHLGAHTASIAVTAQPATWVYPLRGTGTGGPLSQPGQQVAAVAAPVASAGRLTLAGSVPAEGVNDTPAAGIADDGSLTLLDSAGTALLHVPPRPRGPADILLDTTRADVPDGIGLARLLDAATSRNGVSAVLALRADNSRGIYRLEKNALTVLAVSPEARGPVPMVISGAGEIAYVAPASQGPLALFQTTRGLPRELLRQGSVAPNGATIGAITDLSGNEAGDLTFLIGAADGSPLAVMRRRAGVLDVVTQVGQAVAGSRSPAAPVGKLAELRRPRIGPDGSVLFEGAGDGFANFYLAPPGRPLAALLDGADWNRDPAAFDYDLSAAGTAAVRATHAASTGSLLYRITAGGVPALVAGGRRDAEPVGRPAFGPDERLFFLAQNLDLPPDRDGRAPAGLYRSRPGGAVPEAVALPGQAVPDRPSARWLTVRKRPVITAGGIVVAAQIGGLESQPVPTQALFELPLDGTLAQGTLVAADGAPVSNAGRLALPREPAYLGDGTTVYSALLPGGAPFIALSPLPPATAAVPHTQASAPTAIAPLIAAGDNLGPGQLADTLPPLLALGPDRELFAARFSQSSGLNGEGLFTVSRKKQIGQIAVTRASAPGTMGAVFNGFVDTQRFTVSPPSIAPDGAVVFKALLDGAGLPFGIFQWAPASSVDPLIFSDTPVAAQEPVPYRLEHWAAGDGGVAYIQVRDAVNRARLFAAQPGGKLQVLVESGVTPAPGGLIADLSDFLPAPGGDLYVAATVAGSDALFRLTQGQLLPLAAAGGSVPPLADGRGAGLVFAGSFVLLPQSAHRDLLFRAAVRKPGDAQVRRGSFRIRQGKLETLAIESVGVEGARSLAVDSLADTLETQNGNGTSVSAYFTAKDGWVIVRSHLDRQKATITSQIIAQAGPGRRPDVPWFAALDAGPLLEQEGAPPHAGPVFTLNEAGDVAFLASDGRGWGVYQVPFQ